MERRVTIFLCLGFVFLSAVLNIGTAYAYNTGADYRLSGRSVSASSQQEQKEPKEIHVAVSGNDESGSGTQDAPYATVSKAAEAAPGSVIFVHEGIYDPIRLGTECSGSEKSPTIICPAEGERAIIHAGDGTGISLVNVSHIIVEGLEIEGGTHGIYYESTREAGRALTDICFRGCRVHGVR